MSEQPAASEPPILRAGGEHGEVPRRERRHDPDRLLHHELARALGAARHDAPVAATALFRVPVDDVGGGEHLGTRFDVDLALLLHHHLRDGIVALAHEVGGLAHDFRAVVGRRRTPQGEALLGGLERLVEIGLAGVGQVRERLLGRRIDDVLALAAVAAVDPLAVDVEREIGIHGVLVTPGAGVACTGISTFCSQIHPSPLLSPSFRTSERSEREPESSNHRPLCSFIVNLVITGCPLVRA